MTTCNYLAIDLGASSGRALLGAFDGARFHLSDIHRFPNAGLPLMGGLYWNVLALWQEIKHSISHYTHTHSTALSGIGVDTWGVDFGLLDASDELLGNPRTYRDGRNTGLPEVLASVIIPEALYQRTGIQVIQFNTLYQLYGRVQAADPQLSSAATLLMMPDLINFFLSGEKASEYTIASTSHMLSAQSRTWDHELLQHLDIPSSILPAILEPATILAPVRPALAKQLGVTATPVIAVASHDTASAVAAIPNLDAQSAYISSGTWSLIGVECPAPNLSPEAQRLNVTNEGGVASTVRLLKNLAGMWPLQEVRREYHAQGQMYSWEELFEKARQAPAFSALIDPNHASLLSPETMTEAIRHLCKASQQPPPETPAAIARCILESLALSYRAAFEALQSLLDHPLTVIRIVGGGAQNSLLNQFTADACGVPVVAGPVEATALGNLMVQALATGEIGSLAQGREVVGNSCMLTSFTPTAESSALWDEAFNRYQKLIAKQALDSF